MQSSLQSTQHNILENYLSVLLGDGALSEADTAAHCVDNSEPTIVSSDDIHILPFTVVGLALALEKAAVVAVLPWPARGLGAPKASDADEILGTLQFGGRTAWVLDTAKWVVPANHPGRPNLLARRQYKLILLLKDEPVALACDAVDEDIIVDQSAVQWRSDVRQYGWMKASLPAFGCALIDPTVAAQFCPTT